MIWHTILRIPMEKEVNPMNFFQSKKKWLLALMAVLLAAGLWYVLSQRAKNKEPEGTLVWNRVCMEVSG